MLARVPVGGRKQDRDRVVGAAGVQELAQQQDGQAGLAGPGRAEQHQAPAGQPMPEVLREPGDVGAVVEQQQRAGADRVRPVLQPVAVGDPPGHRDRVRQSPRSRASSSHRARAARASASRASTSRAVVTGTVTVRRRQAHTANATSNGTGMDTSWATFAATGRPSGVHSGRSMSAARTTLRAPAIQAAVAQTPPGRRVTRRLP
ncbi:hypothetical protein GCM10029964_091060 [Kibdelosporangium lantanae]